MGKLAKALTASAGNAGGDKVYVEDVFSTFLYGGTGSSNAIANGIDLSGEGGLVWGKRRNLGNSNWLIDTVKGITSRLESDGTGAATNSSSSFTSFNSNGFTVATSDNEFNNTSGLYASWTFRKAKKFFDVVTYTGNGTAGRTVAHNLGSVPGMMIVKCTNAGSTEWIIYHASTGATKYLLFTTAAAGTFTNFWNDTTPTDSVFSLGVNGQVNGNGDTFVAYLFASDAGGFGDDGDENIIKCGSFSYSSSDVTVNLGWEPQWILIKNTTSAGVNWELHDTMRGFIGVFGVANGGEVLFPNLANPEAGQTSVFKPTSTGFVMKGNEFASGTYIYMAIRRGPMKTPDDATKVFAIDTSGSSASQAASPPVQYYAGFPVDLMLKGADISGVSTNYAHSRLTAGRLQTESRAVANYVVAHFDSSQGYRPIALSSNLNYIAYLFQRAPGFMDVVNYISAGGSSTAVTHNLGVVPELIIGKDTADLGANWGVYCAYAHDPTKAGALNVGTEGWAYSSITNSQTPTATNINATGEVNQSAEPNVLYLFATLAGVSKVGSYTGNAGYAVNVPCGFSNGARFILIKRTDTAGDWYYWDTLRGIAAGNDPYLLLNSTAAQVTNTDYIDPLSSGFTVTSSAPAGLNASGGTYIFLAIA